ncbi:MAG: tape measure protein [Dorea sp.]|jgi:tape measure domain-containing protein|nr:tape measure protein [Dorea sp.]
METYSTKAVLSVADNGFTSKMRSAAASVEDLESTSRKASNSITNIMKGAGAFKVASMAVDTLKNSLTGAVSRFDTMNQFPKVMQQIGFSAEESEASISKLSDGIQGVPTSLDEITASAQKLAMLTGDLGKATDASIALNNAFYASGASSADASRGLVQYTQMLSKGTVDIMSWRTLQETMGIALRDLAEAFGYAGSAATTDLYAAIQSGQITFDQLNDKLIELDGGVDGFAARASAASAGIGTSLTNMEIAVTRGMEGIIRSTNDALANNGLPGFQEMIENTTSGINQAFSVASKGVEVLVNNLDVLVPVLGTATTGFLAYKAAMNISSRAAELRKGMAEAVGTLRAAADASRLAEASALARAKADKAAELADKLCRKSAVASAAAIKSKAAAEKVSEAAAQARALADAGGAEATGLKAAADKMEAAAAKAQANANRDAARAETLKRAAENADTRATALNTAAEGANTLAETAGAKAATVSTIAIAAKTAMLGVLSGELGIVAAAQMVWNKAMSANPIGIVITTVAALAAVLVGVSKALEKLDTESAEARKRREETISSSKDLIEALESTGKAYDETVSDIKAQASANDELAGKIEKLAKKEHRSAEEKAELQSYVEALNSSMDDLNLQYDAENDALSMSTDQIKAKVDAYNEQAEAQEAQERYTEILKEQSQVNEQLAAIESERNDIEKEYQDSVTAGPKVLYEYNKATGELKEQEEELNEKKKELATTEEYLTGVMEQCQAEQTEAVKTAQEQQKAALAESIASQTASLEDLTGANQETVGALGEAWQGYADKATDMFDQLSDKQTLSVDKMIANLQENQRIISEYGDNMDALRERFDNLNLSEGVLDDLAEMGPEGAGYVAALASASDEQLQTLASTMEAGGQLSKDKFMQAWDFDDGSIPEGIQKMFMQAESSLRETVAATDWASIGDDITTGLTGGIDAGAGDAYDSGGNLGENVEDGTRDYTQTHSPSALFKSIGQDLVAGLAQGLMDSGMATDAAVRMADNVIRAVREAMDGADFAAAWDHTFSGMSGVASGNMSKVSSVVKSGMSVSVSAVSAGTARMQSMMNAGMNSMGALVKAGMLSVENQGKSGMARLDSAVKSGMSKAKANMSNGVSGMVSALSVMQPRFYSAGYYSAIGLANGINAGSGAAIAAANRVASQVAATMERALKIGSPSRITREIGGFTTEGFVLGLLNDIQKVRAASEELADAAIPTGEIASRVAFAGDIGHMLNNMGSPSFYASDEYSYSHDATYTIVVPVELEGREIAKASATYTKEELELMEKMCNYRKGKR